MTANDVLHIAHHLLEKHGLLQDRGKLKFCDTATTPPVTGSVPVEQPLIHPLPTRRLR